MREEEMEATSRRKAELFSSSELPIIETIMPENSRRFNNEETSARE